VDQQARYNMNLIPQYGGTVGGFRRKVILETGGFDERVLAEDTELTYRLYIEGWRIVYDNSAECYEQSPVTWKSRGRQVRRWSRGHNTVLARYLLQTITAEKLRLWTKIDAVLLLFVYTAPVILGLGFLDCIALFFLGEMNIFNSWWVLLFVGAYNTAGNFSPFYQVAAGALLDGMRREITLLPLLCFSYYFYMVNICAGFIDAQFDIITGRRTKWAKTERTTKLSQAGKHAAESGSGNGNGSGSGGGRHATGNGSGNGNGNGSGKHAAENGNGGGAGKAGNGKYGNGAAKHMNGSKKAGKKKGGQEE
jgi:cellulose synthase/poly-beta-1,6-N-acetylglucosamine synthase-like glycosyltransferase